MSRAAVEALVAALAEVDRSDMVLHSELQKLVERAKAAVSRPVDASLALALAVKRNADAQLHARVAALLEEIR